MKRKLFLGLAGLAIVAAAAIVTVSAVNANSTESDLLTKNLEALTQTEDIVGDCPFYGTFNFYEEGCGQIEVYSFGCGGGSKGGGCQTGYELVKYDCFGNFQVTHSESYWVSCYY